tara:strand:- start:1961 stop:2212 length:252 start_codon:yes stop_codon:yes gene_type:complete
MINSGREWDWMDVWDNVNKPLYDKIKKVRKQSDLEAIEEILQQADAHDLREEVIRSVAREIEKGDEEMSIVDAYRHALNDWVK